MDTTDTPLRPAAWPADDTTIVTDGGLETWLMFHRGIDLPAFAAYPLASDEAGRRLLVDYYRRYLSIAADTRSAVLLETPTWRANPDWGRELGHDPETLETMLTAAVRVVLDLRGEWVGPQPLLVSGAVGPRGDGYVADTAMTVDEAAGYHSFQVERMTADGVDLVTALTIGDVAEAAGFALAARRAGVPSVVSFTVETDGRLPSGTLLGEAIDRTDELTDGAPMHYMVNCAHPTHFASLLDGSPSWTDRIGGVRANASMRSHAELDEMDHLDEGDAADLAERYQGLLRNLPAARVLGGCCGTDERHVGAIVQACRVG